MEQLYTSELFPFSKPTFKESESCMANISNTASNCEWNKRTATAITLRHIHCAAALLHARVEGKLALESESSSGKRGKFLHISGPSSVAGQVLSPPFSLYFHNRNETCSGTLHLTLQAAAIHCAPLPFCTARFHLTRMLDAPRRSPVKDLVTS